MDDLFETRGSVANVAGEPLPKARVTLAPVDHRMGGVESVAVTAPDGRFLIPGSAYVAAGTYSLRLYQLQPDAYVKSVRYGGRDADPYAVDLADTIPGALLEIDLAFDSAVLTGTVIDSDGAPMPSAMVFVRSSANAGPSPDGSARTDQDGRFAIRSLAPGGYRVSAAARPRQAHEAGGTPLSLGAAERRDLTLRASDAIQ